MSLRLKLTAGTAGAFLVFGCLVLGDIHSALSGLLGEELCRRGVAIATTLLASAETPLLTGNDIALHQLLQEARSAYDDVRYIYVEDGRGKAAAHTFGAGMPKGLRESVRLRAGERSRATRLETEEGPMTDIAVAFPLEGMGSVHVGMRRQAVAGRIVSMTAAWGGAAAAALALGAGFVFWTTTRVTRRLNRLVGFAEAVGRGELDARAPGEGRDELDRLGRAFNRMVRDLKETQAEVVRTGKLAAVGELATCVAHEINNPLNTMSVCSQALLERAASKALAAEADFADFPDYLRTIDREIARCKRITSDLLLFTHPRPPHRTRVDVNGLIDETLSLLAHRPGSGQASFERDLAPGLPAILADPDQVRQVLINILENALDHLGDGGRVRVKTEPRGRGLAVIVSDNGPGIPAEDAARIFDLFFTTKKAGKGSGLGLAICRKIVEAHGGRIEVESEPGRGSTFSIALPPGTGGTAARAKGG